MLTRRQHTLLVFIEERLTQTGCSPSFKEMQDALALRSTSGVYRLINALEERGFIARLHGRARALHVLRLPQNLARRKFACGTERATDVVGNMARVATADQLAIPRTTTHIGVVQVPFLGRITDGFVGESSRGTRGTVSGQEAGSF